MKEHTIYGQLGLIITQKKGGKDNGKDRSEVFEGAEVSRGRT